MVPELIWTASLFINELGLKCDGLDFSDPCVPNYWDYPDLVGDDLPLMYWGRCPGSDTEFKIWWGN
ncbi:MAG: hypothetical protein OSB44_02175 [Verrucomicrobiales bacterium]|nr:hypothetical protein [Verrucomicrobiales bacterium]